MLCLSFTPSSKLLIRLQRESERATKKRRWKRAKAERKENGNKTIWQKQSWSFTSTDFFKLNKTIERVRKKERDQKCETEAKEGDAVSWIPGRVRPLANHDPSLTDPRAFPRGHCVYTSRRWWKGRSNKLPKWRRKFTEKCPFRDNPPPPWRSSRKWRCSRLCKCESTHTTQSIVLIPTRVYRTCCSCFISFSSCPENIHVQRTLWTCSVCADQVERKDIRGERSGRRGAGQTSGNTVGSGFRWLQNILSYQHSLKNIRTKESIMRLNWTKLLKNRTWKRRQLNELKYATYTACDKRKEWPLRCFHGRKSWRPATVNCNIRPICPFQVSDVSVLFMWEWIFYLYDASLIKDKRRSLFSLPLSFLTSSFPGSTFW